YSRYNRYPRRVPPCRHRAEPQDAGAAPHPAATTARLRESGVALVGSVCVEAEAHIGEARKPPSALYLQIKPTLKCQRLSQPTFSTTSVTLRPQQLQQDA